MVSSLRRELSKIIDVMNHRKFKFVFLYGVMKALWVALVLSLLFLFLGTNDSSVIENLENIGIRLILSIIPGAIWGLVEYSMYKDIIDERKKYRINTMSYVMIYGILGWGIICAVANMDFVPYNAGTIIAGLVSLPIYGLVLGILSKKMFNTKGYIKKLYVENLKGKDIKSITKKNNTLQMK